MPSKKHPQKKESRKRKLEIDVTDTFIEQKVEELKIKEFKWTPNHKKLISLILDDRTRAVFLSGPSGSAKTLTAIYAGLKLLQDKKVNDINYLRSIVESAFNKIGYLPGTADDKCSPYFAPMEEKLDELLPQTQIKNLVAEQTIKAGPINYLRGRTLQGYVVVDEAQCLDFKELTTVMTRLKEGSKTVFCGDFSQIDSRQSGFSTFYHLFDTPEAREKGIFCLSFGPEDIKRSQILKFVCETIESYQK